MQQLTHTEGKNPQPLAGADRAVIFKTAALGRPGGTFALPKIVGNPSAAAKAAYRTILDAAMKFDSQLDELNIRLAGKMVSKEESQQFRRDNRVSLGVGALEALNVVKDARAKTEAQRQRLLTVPPLAANDFATAIAENEARIGIRAMTPQQRAAMFNEIAAGKHPQTLLALCRDPIPGSQLAESARGTYRAFATKTQAEPLLALAAEDDAHESIEAGLLALQELVASA
jgi:hypothetical protein